MPSSASSDSSWLFVVSPVDQRQLRVDFGKRITSSIQSTPDQPRAVTFPWARPLSSGLRAAQSILGRRSPRDIRPPSRFRSPRAPTGECLRDPVDEYVSLGSDTDELELAALVGRQPLLELVLLEVRRIRVWILLDDHPNRLKLGRGSTGWNRDGSTPCGGVSRHLVREVSTIWRGASRRGKNATFGVGSPMDGEGSTERSLLR